ncbi:uncharacterized protein LOC127787682 [Diospyros lotus]|uniref:uncharacterized protein LOC127787682 n=1 Tax=Diospyros lotus TaxID=55363 RepID=UPI002253494A|nr:uncharacterized protein LOC127787682 [Diospyros lotus]
METLVVVAQHRNEYHSRSRAQGQARLGWFGSPPSRGFTEINCRTFQFGAGILPSPLNACTTPVTKRVPSYLSSPKTASPHFQSRNNDESEHLKKTARSSAIPIPININATPRKEQSFNDGLTYSELWAGPAYSNSPPPSSVPLPKFSLRPKRTVSLELPSSPPCDIDFHPIAKSAPPSPTRNHSSSSGNPFDSADSATRTLRRMLNLDISDE